MFFKFFEIGHFGHCSDLKCSTGGLGIFQLIFMLYIFFIAPMYIKDKKNIGLIWRVKIRLAHETLKNYQNGPFW